MDGVSSYLCTDADISLPLRAKPEWKADCRLLRICSHIKGCRITLRFCEWRMKTSRTRPRQETNTTFSTLNSSVGIATGYGLDDRPGFESQQGQIFSLLPSARICPGGHVPRDISPGVNRPGSEAGRILPSSAEVKNGEAIFPLHFMVWFFSN
jgi:hypothetical protein